MAEENLLRSMQRKDEILKEKKDALHQETHEVGHTGSHPFMTEDPLTEQSALAAHRVLPYHFKGLNEGQIGAILNERQMQVDQKKLIEEQKKKEEKLWAKQAEQLRRMQVASDRQHK
jgi:hypothetical protein